MELANKKRKQARREKRLQRLQEERRNPWSDETYAYIAGYTAWGFPYGITWEECEQFADQESLDGMIPAQEEGCMVSYSDEQDWPDVVKRDAEEEPFDLEEFLRYYG